MRIMYSCPSCCSHLHQESEQRKGGAWSAASIKAGVETLGGSVCLNHLVQEENTKESKGRRLGMSRQLFFFLNKSPDLHDLGCSAFANEAKRSEHLFLFISSVHISQNESKCTV